jgi:hypothetical protein
MFAGITGFRAFTFVPPSRRGLETRVKTIGILALSFVATIAPAIAQTEQPEQPVTPPMTVPLANKHLAGVVESIDRVNGELRLVVRDSDGYDDDVTLASDARIRPAGSHLAVGDRVLFTGYNAGSYFDATAASIAGTGAVAEPAPQAPSYAAPAAPPPQTQLPSYAVPDPGYAYVPYPVYVPAPVYYAYPAYGYPVTIGIGFGFYGGYRGPGYFARGGYGRGYARFGYRR